MPAAKNSATATRLHSVLVRGFCFFTFGGEGSINPSAAAVAEPDGVAAAGSSVDLHVEILLETRNKEISNSDRASGLEGGI